MAGALGRAKLVTSWPGSKGEEEDRLGSHLPLQGHIPMTSGPHDHLPPKGATPPNTTQGKGDPAFTTWTTGET